MTPAIASAAQRAQRCRYARGTRSRRIRAAPGTPNVDQVLQGGEFQRGEPADARSSSSARMTQTRPRPSSGTWIRDGIETVVMPAALTTFAWRPRGSRRICPPLRWAGEDRQRMALHCQGGSTRSPSRLAVRTFRRAACSCARSATRCSAGPERRAHRFQAIGKPLRCA